MSCGDKRGLVCGARLRIADGCLTVVVPGSWWPGRGLPFPGVLIPLLLTTLLGLLGLLGLRRGLLLGVEAFEWVLTMLLLLVFLRGE